MKQKLVPYSIIVIFFVIFVVFYKSLEDTNIYTPEVKINNDIPIFSAERLLSNETLDSKEIFQLDKFYILNIWSSLCAPPSRTWKKNSCCGFSVWGLMKAGCRLMPSRKASVRMKPWPVCSVR